jgi:hypothetical protein
MPDKGKVERPYRYIREDFFLARSFQNLDELNAQLRHWLDTVANPRTHATTGRVVAEAFAEEQPPPCRRCKPKLGDFLHRIQLVGNDERRAACASGEV